MDAQKVDMFFLANGSNLPARKAPVIREKLLSLDDSKWTATESTDSTSATRAWASANC